MWVGPAHACFSGAASLCPRCSLSPTAGWGGGGRERERGRVGLGESRHTEERWRPAGPEVLNPLVAAFLTCMAKCWCCWTGSPGWGSGTRGEPYSFVGSDPRRGPNVPGTAGLWGTRGVWEGEIKQSVKRRKAVELLQVRGSQGWRNHTDEQMGFLEIPRKTVVSFLRGDTAPLPKPLSHTPATHPCA